jgi:hypothetical protein
MRRAARSALAISASSSGLSTRRYQSTGSTSNRSTIAAAAREAGDGRADRIFSRADTSSAPSPSCRAADGTETNATASASPALRPVSEVRNPSSSAVILPET